MLVTKDELFSNCGYQEYQQYHSPEYRRQYSQHDYYAEDTKLMKLAEELAQCDGASIFLRNRSGEYVILQYFICGN